MNFVNAAKGIGRRRLGAVAAAFGASAVSTPSGVRSATYPPGPVTVIVAFPAGAGTDIVTRVLTERLSRLWNQPVIVDNRGGGNGIVAAELAAKAKPDGLTLFATSAMTQAVNPALYEKLPYDPIKDFEPITQTITVPFVLLIDAKSKIASLRELTFLIKGEPGKHNYAAGTLPSRAASELYKVTGGIDATYVGYKSNPQAFPDIQNGLITFMMVDTINAKIAIDRGALKGLVVTDSTASPLLPTLPTAAAAGVPELVLTTWAGLFAPKGTPRPIVLKINADVASAMEDPSVGDRLEALGGRRTVTTPDAFGAFCQSELGRWAKVIKIANIKLE